VTVTLPFVGPLVVPAEVAYVADVLLKALIVWIVVRVVRKFGDVVTELRDNVSGIYVTRTSDTAWLGAAESAHVDEVNRYLYLWQSGRKLKGTEAGKGENAAWSLDAELTPDGFIIGKYTQTRPRTGISRGAFYMEQDRRDPTKFAGHFSGWHAEKRAVTSNKYDWKRVRSAPFWTILAPRVLRGLWVHFEKPRVER
jgi:hypothetical protein